MKLSWLLLFSFIFYLMPAHAENRARGEILFETCKGCHGVKGLQTVYPTYHVPLIYGQSKSYLISALKGYRDGRRKHPTMRFNSASLKDVDIQDISAYLSTTHKNEEND